MSDPKTIAFFPEGAFGPALNSVGIAQACRQIGHEPVFICDPGFGGVFGGYGFDEYHVPMSEPMAPEAMAKYWSDFIDGHIPNFHNTPFEQIDNYVKECWAMVVDTSVWAQKTLPDVLDRIAPDLICIDNVVLFPAAKQYGVPWVRIISCSENEIPDPDIPPHLSGCAENDKACFEAFERRFREVVGPTHVAFNAFLESCGEAPYPPGQFFEASPYLNLLLYPEPVKFKRRNPLDPSRFQYLEGCVRKEEPYEIPDFAANAGGIINIAEEFTGYSLDRALARTACIEDTITAIFERARVENRGPARVATDMARERIARDGSGRRWHPGDPAAWTRGQPLRRLRPEAGA